MMGAFLSFKFHDSRFLMYGGVVQEDNAVASEVGIGYLQQLLQELEVLDEGRSGIGPSE